MKKITILFLLIIVCFMQVQAQQLRIGSYNIRYDNPGDVQKGNGWQQRLPVMCEQIRYHDFDIWGGQEVLHHQLNDLLAGLPEYGYVGAGRDDGKTEGEYAPVFYKKDKFATGNSGHFWLSDDTSKPNTGWDAALPRICTYTQLICKESGKKIWFFNLHMDHIGVEARKESGKLVLAKIKEMCGTEPVILTGDFNVDQTNESYQLIHNSGVLADSYETARIRYAVNGTFNGFNPNRKTESRIDHIFVSPGFTVESFAVLTDTYWGPATENDSVQSGYVIRFPSDHFPIIAVLKM